MSDAHPFLEAETDPDRRRIRLRAERRGARQHERRPTHHAHFASAFASSAGMSCLGPLPMYRTIPLLSTMTT